MNQSCFSLVQHNLSLCNLKWISEAWTQCQMFYTWCRWTAQPRTGRSSSGRSPHASSLWKDSVIKIWKRTLSVIIKTTLPMGQWVSVLQPRPGRSCQWGSTKAHIHTPDKSRFRRKSWKKTLGTQEENKTFMAETNSYQPEPGDFQLNSLSFGEVAALLYSARKVTREMQSINKVKWRYLTCWRRTWSWSWGEPNLSQW